MRRAVDEAHDQVARSRLLAAHVEIMLAAGDVAAARGAADELAGIAEALDVPLLHAISASATGAVLLAEGEPRSALTALRRAWSSWQELEAPHEAAQTRVLIGLACRALGDEDTAEMELDAARWAFAQLGAAPDLARVDALSHRATKRDVGGLTVREVEVLRLLAAGKTNRAISSDLFLSEKTVARHVSNIFAKLNLSSRAAATAYAYEHGLV
jgi:DNA-binding NarL/FixJ family response regulator